MKSSLEEGTRGPSTSWVCSWFHVALIDSFSFPGPTF